MKRTILSLSLVLVLALFSSVAFADALPIETDQKPATAEKAETPKPAEKPAAEKPAAKLSVEPQETESELPLDDKSAGVVGGFKDQVKSRFGKDPLLWGIVTLVLSFLGYRGTKGALTHAASITSAGEVFGMALIGGGFLGFANGLARCFDWSQLNMTMISGGILAVILGIGFTTQANEDRRTVAKEPQK